MLLYVQMAWTWQKLCYSTNRLTWHQGIIPDEELWIKIGGDKGGKSMKVFFQICNTPSPNSVHNTLVFSIFEAKDTPTNLHIALDRYSTQVDTLQELTWRYICIYMYIHLCAILHACYTLISLGEESTSVLVRWLWIWMSYLWTYRSSRFVWKSCITCIQLYIKINFLGRHPCLWCNIKSASMKVPRGERGRSEPRTLQSLQRDCQAFETAGKGDLKQAKMYNNVISHYFFNIPIHQVSKQEYIMCAYTLYAVYTCAKCRSVLRVYI